MITLKFAPLSSLPGGWPGTLTYSSARKAGAFKGTYDDTIKKLRGELDSLNAKNPAVYLGFTKLRKDGLPYADNKPLHPGVVLMFDYHGQTLRFCCDTLTDWKNNLRAIAGHLELLRQLKTYSIIGDDTHYKPYVVTKPAGQSAGNQTGGQSAGSAGGQNARSAGGTGYRANPGTNTGGSSHQQRGGYTPPPPPKPRGYTEAVILLTAAGEPVTDATINRVLADETARKAVWRKAMLKTHPDQGGTAERFRAVQNANEYLTNLKGK